MTFLETFSAVLSATIIGQIALWFVQRYITSHFTYLADKIDKPIKTKVKRLFKKKNYTKSLLFGKHMRKNG